jgi:hypothetical protein
MDHPYWFGVTFTFSCPVCKKLSAEKAAVNSPTIDSAKIRERLDWESLRCKHCHAPLANGVNVVVDVLPGTLEYLKAAGFPFPLGI